MPRPHIHFFKNIIYNCPYANYKWAGKVLSILSSDVMWKDKYDSPRHERDPFIWVCFFRTFGFSINFKVDYIDTKGKKLDGGLYYWEYLLGFLYYNRDLTDYDRWRDSNTKEYVPTPQFSLKKKMFYKAHE